jgi:O-antigen/teichoic acid export membrane protein
VTLATTLMLLLATVAPLGLPEAVLRFYYDEKHGEAGARSLIASSAFVALGITVAAAALVLIAAGFGLGDTEELLFGCALALPTAVYGSCMALLRAQERSGAFVAVALTASIGAQVLAIVGVIVRPVPAAYLVGVMVAVTVATLAGLVLTRSIRIRPASRATLRAALAYALPTVPYTASIFALAFADRFVVGAIDGTAAVGQYQVAFAFGFIGVVLVQSLQLAWVPMTFGAAEDSRWTTLADLARTVTRLAAFCAAFLALTAQPVLSVLVPGDYDTDLLAEVAAIASLATVGWALFMSRTQVLLWTKTTRPLAWIAPGAVVFNLALVAVLLPPFGLQGAAAATAVAVVAQAALIGRAARGVAPVVWHRRAELGAYAFASGCAAVALVLPDDAWGVAIRCALLVVVILGFVRTLAAELRLTRRSTPVPAVDPPLEDRTMLELG